MAAHSNGQAIIFLPCGFLYLLLLFSSIFFPRLISDVADWMSVILPHMLCCGLSTNLRCRSETCCARLTGNAGLKNRQKVAIWAPSHNFVGLHVYLRNYGMYRQSEKIYLPTCSYNMVNFGPLGAEIRWRV